MNERIKFPRAFYWGAATAGHQVEGNNTNDWSEWEQSNQRIRFLKSEGLMEKYGLENYISGRAADHYNRFREDFKIAKELGHNATRFSIEWSRIEPKEGHFNKGEIAHYRQVIVTLKDLGIEPFVSLWHWPIPIWLRDKGGWDSKKAADYFTRYAERIAKSLGGDVKYWITLNEPVIYTSASYLAGVWPPQKKSPCTYWRVLQHLIKAHKGAYRVIKKVNPGSRVGIAKSIIYFEAHTNRLDNILLKRFIDWWQNYYFLHQIKLYQDFIGVNHYFRNRINFGFNKNESTCHSDMGWELYPESIYYVLRDLKRFDKPIYITESGLADAKDEKRGWFILNSLRNVSRAIDEGVDVRGYLYWSLMDNFEWDKGFWPKFGLLEIDLQTLKRKVRPSAKMYRDICKANGITEDIVSKYKKVINLRI